MFEPVTLPWGALCWTIGLFAAQIFSLRTARFRRYRWHCFISYTTREHEIRQVKPFIDDYVAALQAQGITVCPVFYDGWYLRRGSYSGGELAGRLRRGIRDSAFTVAFLSPSYPQSDWCCYEWTTTERVHRRRRPPAPEYSILPICWKEPIRRGQCLDAIEERRWISVDIRDPAGLSVAVERTLEFHWQWQR